MSLVKLQHFLTKAFYVYCFQRTSVLWRCFYIVTQPCCSNISLSVSSILTHLNVDNYALGKDFELCVYCSNILKACSESVISCDQCLVKFHIDCLPLNYDGVHVCKLNHLNNRPIMPISNFDTNSSDTSDINHDDFVFLIPG